MSREGDLEIAQNLAREGEMDQAYIIADRYLKDNPNDLPFLTIMVYVMLGSDKTAIGYSLAKHACSLAPKDPAVWVNMGMAAQDLWQSKEAERAYRRGIKCAQNKEQELMLLVNLCAMFIDIGNFVEAEKWALKSLEIDSDHRKGQANLGFCQLAQRKWKKGWVNYHKCLGHDWRPVVQYNNEPEWDGSTVDTVALYAEQGLGDVLSFASMVPDAQKRARVIMDVNASLASLLQRSFPDAKVYGTRMAKKLAWATEDQTPDASISMGQLGEFFRNSDEEFPGTPYLVPDPDRSMMWKSLFKSKRKPVIGIAWRGGIPKTAARYRQLDLEQLLPLFKSVDAHWVSLQYKPAAKEIAAFREKHPEIDLVEYPHGTLTKDYDDTAALVSALDHAVIMQTAVGHLAGGLGVPCWTFVPTTSQWRYGMEGEDYVWANSVRIIRQKERGKWVDVIQQTGDELATLFPGIPETATKATRKGKLRSNREKVRPNGVKSNGHDGDRPSA
jgi:tetratricopeptide (TPR) repeat protein